MTRRGVLLATAMIGAGGGSFVSLHAALAQPAAGLDKIQTVVVIYAENRSFDNLYGDFPGANGLADLKVPPQLDRDGGKLHELPPVWNGLTAKGVRRRSRKQRPNTCRRRRSRWTT